MLYEADDTNFHQAVEQHHGPVLVEFYTPNCGPCRQLEPHLKRLANDMTGQLKVVKVNSNTSPQTARAFGVRMAPTFLLFNNGLPVHVIQGNPGPDRLRSFAQSIF